MEIHTDPWKVWFWRAAINAGDQKCVLLLRFVVAGYTESGPVSQQAINGWQRFHDIAWPGLRQGDFRCRK